jgi:O-methyltransferase
MDFSSDNYSAFGATEKNKSLKFWSKFTRRFLGADLSPLPKRSQMLTLEQSVNIFHLVNQVIQLNVEGDMVELGSLTGSTAMQIQRILESDQSKIKLHLFDHFRNNYFNPGMNALDELHFNFYKQELKIPVIHKGEFKDTLPDELPPQISFAHIDCCVHSDIEVQKELVSFCLESVYPLLSSNAICLLMDYHDIEKTIGGSDSNPGVKLACDQFLNDKPEKVSPLYGGHYSHGYFKKEA